LNLAVLGFILRHLQYSQLTCSFIRWIVTADLHAYARHCLPNCNVKFKQVLRSKARAACAQRFALWQ